MEAVARGSRVFAPSPDFSGPSRFAVSQVCSGVCDGEGFYSRRSR